MSLSSIFSLTGDDRQENAPHTLRPHSPIRATPLRSNALPASQDQSFVGTLNTDTGERGWQPLTKDSSKPANTNYCVTECVNFVKPWTSILPSRAMLHFDLKCIYIIGYDSDTGMPVIHTVCRGTNSDISCHYLLMYVLHCSSKWHLSWILFWKL